MNTLGTLQRILIMTGIHATDRAATRPSARRPITCITVASLLATSACVDRRLPPDEIPRATSDAGVVVDARTITADAKNNDGVPGPVADALAYDGVPGCVYSSAYVCWNCGSDSPRTKRHVVGCDTTARCFVFCAHLPAGYVECYYESPTAADEPCATMPEPSRGTLEEACEQSGSPPGQYGPVLACYGCLYAAYVVTFARGPEGACREFSDSCIPDGYAWDEHCEPDSGVPSFQDAGP